MQSLQFPTLRGPRLVPAVLACAVMLLFFALPTANAAAVITANPQSPVVGEQITFTAQIPGECAPTYVFTIDGAAQPPSNSRDLVTTFSTPGSHTVGVTRSSSCDGTVTESLTITINRALGGSINVTPNDPAYTNQGARFEATQTGGSAPYTYAWDSDNDGAFDDATTRFTTRTFTATGSYVVRVRIRDAATPVHETVVSRTVEVVDAPPNPTPTPTPAPCIQELTFALSQFTTEGCFTNVSAQPEQWETTAAIKLNGVTFPDFGQTFTITKPTTAEPGGHFKANDSAVQLGDLTAYSGDIDWTLPAGVQGEEAAAATFSVPPFAELFRLRVRGSTELRLGWDAAGEHYAVFPFKVELPAIFKPAPDPSSESVTAIAPVRVDSAGPRYDGLKLQATDVWIGRIRVPELCFSHIPASGQSIEPCPKPTLDGEPYLTCETTAGTERFDGNAILELPVDTKLRYAAFGGLIDGQLSSLGGFTDNFAAAGVQLVPGVFLNRLGAGVCLNPPPLKVRGDVGAEALNGKLLINGRFIYTDATSGRSWRVLIGGNTSIAGRELGDGSAEFNAWGDVDFALKTDLNLFGIASLNGSAAGWLEPQRNLFNVTGTLDGCLVDVICAKALGLISSTGVAGCVDAGNLVFYEPVSASQGPFGFGSISVKLRKVVIPLRAGFGHRFGTSSVDLLGNSCDFSAYSATRGPPRWAMIAAGQPLTERIAPNTKAVSLRIHGSDGPPKVVVRGPGGVTITSPKDAAGEQSKGKYILAENTTDGTTSVLLVKPKAGEWTVKAAPGAKSKPTKIDRSNFEAPATFVGRMRKTKKGRDLLVAYNAPQGSKVSLVERGKGLAQTIDESVKGKPCRGVRPIPGAGKLLCARMTFKPSRGPGGTRRVEAVVSRNGVPMSRESVVSFKVPKETLPARPGKLRARRVGGAVVVGFPQVKGASRYSVVAALTDGRRIGFDLGPKCRAVRIPAVPGDVGADVKVAGVRYDLATGNYRRVILAKGKSATGPKGRVKGRVCS